MKKSPHQLPSLALALAIAFLSTNLAWGVSTLNQQNTQTAQNPQVYVSQPLPPPPTIPVQLDESYLPETCEELHEYLCETNTSLGLLQQTNCNHIYTMCDNILSTANQ